MLVYINRLVQVDNFPNANSLGMVKPWDNIDLRAINHQINDSLTGAGRINKRSFKI